VRVKKKLVRVQAKVNEETEAFLTANRIATKNPKAAFFQRFSGFSLNGGA